MKKSIKYSTEVRDELMEKYGVSRTTIWEACSFISRGERPDNIRKDALAMGARYVEENFVPTCSFQNTEDGIIQTFAAGVVLKITQGDAVIMRRGKVVARYDQIDCAGWGSICEQAQHLAETGMLDMAS